MSGISMLHSDIKFNAAKAMVCLGGNTLCHRPDMFLPLQKSLRELTSKRGKKKRKKAKETQRAEKKVGKIGKIKIKNEREREKSQKEDIDESLGFLEEEENRNGANGNPAIPMRVMACEPLGHGLLHR